MHVRTVGALLILAATVAGCMGASTTTFHVAQGIPSDPPMLFAIGPDDGFVIWEVENPLNVSIGILSFHAYSREGSAGAFAVTFFLDAGDAVVPVVVKDHNDLTAPSNDMQAGGQHVLDDPPEFPVQEHDGAESIFTSATRGRLLVVWAGMESGELEVYWHRGTRVTQIATGRDVMVYTNRDMTGGTHMQTETPRTGIDYDRTIGFAAEGATLYGILEAQRAAAQGFVAVTDAKGERSATLAVDAFRVRTTFTSASDVELRLQSDHSNVAVGAVARIPAGVVPDRFWDSSPRSN